MLFATRTPICRLTDKKAPKVFFGRILVPFWCLGYLVAFFFNLILYVKG